VIGVVLNHLNISKKGYYRYHEYYEKSSTAPREEDPQKQTRQYEVKHKKASKSKLA
jgi:hypothetical protein